MQRSLSKLGTLGSLHPLWRAWPPWFLVLAAACSGNPGSEDALGGGTGAVSGAVSNGGITGAGGADPFVTTDGTNFRIGNKRHSFVGTNLWQCMNLGMAASPGDRTRLERELDRLLALGIKNVRIMAASEGPDTEPFRMVPALMTAPGIYNDEVFVGLDFCLNELSTRGMHAVMVLTNFWEWSGGMAQYVKWSDGSEIPYPKGNGTYQSYLQYVRRFYDCASCRQAYRDHVETVIARVNTVSGRTYRDDPTIFSWELANEPRHYETAWISDMGTFIKALDQNHLLTVGSEGNLYEDFLQTHQHASIDYGTVRTFG
jgi:mannan endo-1,4-beta-mannosidase